MILCDTTLIIDVLHEEAEAKQFLLSRPPDELAISVITEWEVLQEERPNEENCFYWEGRAAIPAKNCGSAHSPFLDVVSMNGHSRTTRYVDRMTNHKKTHDLGIAVNCEFREATPSPAFG